MMEPCWLLACNADIHPCTLPQNPALAQEETWAHATGAPEVGGLLLATPAAPGMLGDEYWQVGGWCEV